MLHASQREGLYVITRPQDSAAPVATREDDQPIAALALAAFAAAAQPVAAAALAAAAQPVAAAAQPVAAAAQPVAAAALALAAAAQPVAAAAISIAAATISIAAAQLAGAAAVHSRLRGFEGGLGEAELRCVGRVRQLFLVSNPLVYLRHHTLHRGD